ncbi:MAG: NAD(+) synthase [Brevundimonas sp.]|uniref:NAD(+) synthase n=1 Tax=Brevundimonas sp. TaxID=1871086 RepID=UPI00391AE693
MAQTHSFFDAKTHGFVRVAAASVPVRAAEPAANLDAHVALLKAADEQGVDLLVFPELSLSGYAIDDLHLQGTMIRAVEDAVLALAQASAKVSTVVVAGAALRAGEGLYNCAVVMAGGAVLGVVPKTYLPNYREYYEKRWFVSGAGSDAAAGEGVIVLGGDEVAFGTALVFEAANRPGFTFGVEICEDFWAPVPPSTRLALAGARILCNLSASNVLIGKADERAMLCASQSARTLSAYVFSAAGHGESTTDLAWDGQSLIHELGHEIACGARFSDQPALTVADVDVDRLGLERLRNGTFHDCARAELGEGHAVVVFDAPEPRPVTSLARVPDRFPFVPDDEARLDRDCFEAFSIQVQGLRRRLEATGSRSVVIGVSGGLDSTHALLVACRAFDAMGRPRSDIRAFTLPGFATSEATRANALALMNALGVTAGEIDIRPAATQILDDIDHPYAKGEALHDITFENVQAGLRTDYLFRLANHHQGLVVGTGDLSELALGWATYGVGDHMSHYNVNVGVAKTLIQHLIRWVAARELAGSEAVPILHAILDTEISPELVPAGADGAIQSTESAIGPYALNDFFLFHISRYGLAPSKVAFLAWQAWRDADAGLWPSAIPPARRTAYDLATIRHWLTRFLHRFFATAQFKRSALPNGPKVISGGSLSPRGDWRAPSDIRASTWLKELDRNLPEAVARH